MVLTHLSVGIKHTFLAYLVVGNFYSTKNVINFKLMLKIYGFYVFFHSFRLRPSGKLNHFKVGYRYFKKNWNKISDQIPIVFRSDWKCHKHFMIGIPISILYWIYKTEYSVFTAQLIIKLIRVAHIRRPTPRHVFNEFILFFQHYKS